ncbi:MAG: nucleotidyltransferase family protein [Caldilineaceae bacterium]
MTISDYCVSPETSIRDAIAVIDRTAKGIALVVDTKMFLLGTVTDGDIRRAVIDSLNLDSPVSNLLGRKLSPYLEPVTASYTASKNELIDLMLQFAIRQIPLLDEIGRVADLVTLDELMPESSPPFQAVIMAGGFGTRLRPLTEDLPKPMLPVGDRPLMEWIVDQMRQAGIRQVNVTTHYKAEKIVEHFGDGSTFGVTFNYVNEDQPLGTGGALGLMPTPTQPTLVINGDILTAVDFRAMLEFQREHKADMTVAVRTYPFQIPYGVIDCQGVQILGLREKPTINILVNAGIYLLEPTVYQFIPRGERFNITELIQWLIDAGRTVVSFPIHEYWLDIGQHADYVKAQDDARTGKVVAWS